ncbi:MAG: GNAT family N-acetyltransferase [Deltaproteobacteria bacterium]|nr:GNAT family N-acetyltransferase [Nannocystaceae bacterium]
MIEAFGVGSGVPPDLAKAIGATRQRVVSSSPPASALAALEACAPVLTEAGWNVRCGVSLVYLFESEQAFDSDATIRRSDEARPQWMRAANPGNWHPVEWNELLDGRLGPWTMAVVGHRIVSLCHTPGPLTDRTAECGVWTDPDFRGRGYAAAVTAQWAALLRPSGRHLFYSTDADNHSSRRVADRLQLRLLGHQCVLCAVDEAEESHLHPLSRARANGGTRIDEFSLELTADPAGEDVGAVSQGLDAFHRAHPGFEEKQPLAVFLRDREGAVVVGAVGRTWGESCEVQLLWVREDVRGQGHGTRVLAAVEAEARARGCTKVHLDALSFGASAFYRRLGYREVHTIRGLARGISKHYLEKAL